MSKRIPVAITLLLILGCVSVVAEHLLALDSVGESERSRSDDSTSLMFSRAPSYFADAWIRGEERFPQGGAIVVRNGDDAHLLVPDFAASVDPSLNFEGTSVLFSGKQRLGDPWQVYEVTLRGGSPRRITSGKEDCIRPIHLPDGRLVYSRKTAGRFVLEGATLDGNGAPLPLTYVPGNFLATDVLRDGRVLFESSFPLGNGKQQEIYTVYPDGSGVEAYRCDHVHARSNGKQLVTGDILFVNDRSLGRFTSPLAHEVAVSVPEGDYEGGIAESGNGALIVSFRPTQAQRQGASNQLYSLKLWKNGTRVLSAVATDPKNSLVQPVVIAPHPLPNRFPTALHDWKTTNLLALNSYISRGGQAPRGSIARVRVSTVDATGSVQVLGTAPVEPDGSFFVQAPGDTALKFELLNAQGEVILGEAGWIWARSGEQRICVGCHAGPERAPDNAVPAVLLRTTTPENLTDSRTEAAKGVN